MLETIGEAIVEWIVGKIFDGATGKFSELDVFDPKWWLWGLLFALMTLVGMYVFNMWLKKKQREAKPLIWLGALLVFIYYLDALFIIVMANKTYQNTVRFLTSYSYRWHFLFLVILALLTAFFPLLWSKRVCIFQKIKEESEINKRRMSEYKKERHLKLAGITGNELPVMAESAITPLPEAVSTSSIAQKETQEASKEQPHSEAPSSGDVSQKRKITLPQRYKCPHCNREYSAFGHCTECPNSPILELRKGVLAMQILIGVTIAVVVLVFAVWGVLQIIQTINGR